MKPSQDSIPLNQELCSTCPFRDGVPEKYARLRSQLALSAVTEASRICHQTGKNNTFHKDTGRPKALCRGARDVQLRFLCAIAFLTEPTDEAWNAKCAELGMTPNLDV